MAEKKKVLLPLSWSLEVQLGHFDVLVYRNANDFMVRWIVHFNEGNTPWQYVTVALSRYRLKY